MHDSKTPLSKIMQRHNAKTKAAKKQNAVDAPSKGKKHNNNLSEDDQDDDTQGSSMLSDLIKLKSTEQKQHSCVVEEANDMIYKAIMQYKKMEQQRATALMSDTRTITEAILRKQVEAQSTKLAVSANTQYATNAKYSGKHPRIKVFPGTLLNIFFLNA